MITLHAAVAVPPRFRPNRETVVLLHSSAASSRQWDALVEQLQPVYDVVAIDLHGHGRQPAWAGERPPTVHDDAALALAAIERAGSAHVVGHSYGAAVALHLAAARPSLVRSLALYEAVPFRLLTDHEPHGAAAQEIAHVAGQMRQLLAGGQGPAAAERFVDYWSGGPAWVRLGPEQQGSIVRRMPTVLQHFDALHAEPLPAGRLARLTMPVLCLSGARSTTAALRVAALLRDRLPGARHETLAGLGHMAPITHAAIVNEHLLRFLGVQPSRARAPALAAA